MPRTHVFIIDGTLSRLSEGEETNVGLVYKLLQELPEVTVGYNAGVQGQGLMKWISVLMGNGINGSIRQGYEALARGYQPGDKIFLFGFSRGAYAVRSIAGMIAKVGLLKPEHVKPNRIRKAFRLYENSDAEKRAKRFHHKFCHKTIEIEMIGVWDTVKSLGLPFPVLSYISPMATEFHNHRLSPIIKNAFHALAADENRRAFAPIPWECPPSWPGRLEQAWFAGAHSDVGGFIYEMPEARALSNISLQWMLTHAEMCGLPLPEAWQTRFPTDAMAQFQGPYAGSSKFFLFRSPREFGAAHIDYLHESLIERMKSGYTPRLSRYSQAPAEELSG
ncbi:MAG: DUF2235 domain-containing protein [Rhodobacteraceae bacterium]|nr:DUF2235 domain-containing protein [Paracoccaceae bacterium]